MLALTISVQAQTNGQHERSAFSFKSTKVKNAEGQISHVKVGAYVGNQLIQEFSYELLEPISEELAELHGTVSEEDLNFDGYLDADIYLGYLGGYANNTYHEALLWDQGNHRFIEAEGYNGIGEPTCDAEKKYIQAVLSAGPLHRVTTYYRWKGHKLVKYFENTWAMEDDDYVDFSGLLNYPCHRFDAMLDGRIPVNIVFQKTEEGTVAGYIYYPKAKNPAPIMVAGSVQQYEGTDFYYLNEYQADGTISGVMNLQYKNENWDETMKGTWTNPKTEKELTMGEMTYSREMPTDISPSVRQVRTRYISTVPT